jgi:hypothetical protein
VHMSHSNTCTSGRPLRAGKDSNRCIDAPQRGQASNARSETAIAASRHDEALGQAFQSRINSPVTQILLHHMFDIAINLSAHD